MNNSSSHLPRYEACDVNDPLLLEHLKEINETEENKARCLEIFRRDLKNLKEVEALLDEEFLLPFLRASKYDTSKAMQRLLKYYQNYDVYFNIYKNMTFPVHEADSIQHLTMSPYRCQDHSFLMFGKGAIDYKKFTFAHRFYLEIVGIHQLLENPVNTICGGTYVIDHEGMDIHGYLAFTPFWVRLFFDALVNSFPIRVKAVHLVNTPSFFPVLMKVINAFLPKKIQNRLIFHARKDDWKHLHAYISPDILPEKYGGKLKQEELIDLLKNIKNQEDKVRRLYAYGYIKTKKDRQSLNVLE